jgi:lipopolysaccharide/colanic/teichoic acid biosynthesis glycosyltransferase
MGLNTRIAQRVLDLGVSLVGLALLVPALPFIAVALKVESQGPVFFRDVRVGQQRRSSDQHTGGRRLHDARGHLFMSLRFRVLGEHVNTVGRRRGEHPMLTRVGRFLRRTGLEEWPQLWTVLCGHMSLVGPRSATPQDIDRLRREFPAFRARMTDLRPGLFGYAQSESAEPTTFFAAMFEKIVFDQHYRARLLQPSPWKAVFQDVQMVFANLAGLWASRHPAIGTDVIRIEYPRNFRQLDQQPAALARRMPSDLGGEVVEHDEGFTCWWYPPHRPSLAMPVLEDELLAELCERVSGEPGAELRFTKALRSCNADGVDVVSIELPVDIEGVRAVSEHLVDLWEVMAQRSDDEQFVYSMSFLLIEGLTAVAGAASGDDRRLRIEIQVGREQVRLVLSSQVGEPAEAVVRSHLRAAAQMVS